MRVTSTFSSGSGIRDGENKPLGRNDGIEESYSGSLRERVLPHRLRPPKKAGIA